MEFAVPLLERFLHAIVQLLINPFYYIGVVFILLQYRKQVQLERKLFHTKLHSLLDETWRTLLWGWACGMAASIVMMFIGVSVAAETIMLLWVTSLVLLLFRVRFLCFAYAAGILGIAHSILSWLPNRAELEGSAPMVQWLGQVDVPSLLVIAAVLHPLESFLVGMQGARMASPLFLEGKRGKIVGGYQLQGFWPVPMFLLVPFSGGSTESLPWGTMLHADWSAGWSLLAFPVMIGFTELTISKLPKAQTKLSASLLAVYGIVTLLLAWGAALWTPLIMVSSLLTLLLHEALIRYSQWRELKQVPFFVHGSRGLMVLAVIPKSPAEEMGILAGETISKVNGHAVANKADLHAAIRINSAFCKLEVLDQRGEVRFMQRAIFSGDHHQLGIILAPDQQALYYMEHKPQHLFSYLRGKLTGVSSNQSGKPM
ncbi:PDZ domain-containing protein [Paenibacillus hexagrammi]|uniref:PDZ domain-containing protein n=1 Tax=Paenibacillus hexagrammi TaxID=2908839 RepID=A0ABY3SGK6_9BACL|nr:PDZ domain-containing protein [Paenibacillus sp. YPD9-1]UJF33173.1 PDZ domain-containing protein [Paenibacillus sp. YPD9-1]